VSNNGGEYNRTHSPTTEGNSKQKFKVNSNEIDAYSIQ